MGFNSGFKGLILNKRNFAIKKEFEKNNNFKQGSDLNLRKKTVNFSEREMTRLDLGSCQAAFQYELEAFYLGEKWPVF